MALGQHFVRHRGRYICGKARRGGQEQQKIRARQCASARRHAPAWTAPLPQLPGCTVVDAKRVRMVSCEARYCLSTFVLVGLTAGIEMPESQLASLDRSLFPARQSRHEIEIFPRLVQA